MLRTRKQLIEQRLDHGPQSIVWALQRVEVPDVASCSTVWRILVRHGLITPQPQKRPKSATKRFCFFRPNECWQSDWTRWSLADGAPVAIAGSLDDHSRYMPALRAGLGDATSDVVWSVMLAGITECAIPAMSLTYNGFVYTGKWRGFEATFEANLRALGAMTINSTPFHPQTCGKIERFWQTLKTWLRAYPAPGPSMNSTSSWPCSATSTTTIDRTYRCAASPPPRRSRPPQAQPASRPLPDPVFVYRQIVSPASGNLTVGPYVVKSD